MKTVALGQQKGGCGKSATAINLACVAVADGKKAAIVDLDSEQGTALRWSQRRNGSSPPVTVVSADAASLPAVLDELRADGVQWVFLDLPGRNAPVASAGLVAADMVLVPCRPLDVDIEASVKTITAAKRANKPYSYMMNIAPPQHERLRARQVSEVLRNAGQPVTPVIVVQRIIVPDAISQGRGVNESQPNHESAIEFEELFTWLKRNVK